MINPVANTSPLVNSLFPELYQVKGANFVNFVRQYFIWMEQQYGPRWYTRQIYQIKDIDQTLPEFIVYFKEKYLKNIEFSTEANIRTIIKHALDIYRSKGTERCTTLLFQLAFDTQPKFYYPSTDLMRLSDGDWYLPTYLELRPQRNIPTSIEQKEVRGLFSNAIAFVDSVVRQRQGTLIQDVAYISAVQGTFEAGERIVPTDGSLPITSSPRLLGSLNSITFPASGSGEDYTVGSVIPITSLNGTGGQVLINQVVDTSGVISMTFEDGGWGYQFVQNVATISYSNASGVSFTSNNIGNTNIYTYYANGSVNGVGLISNVVTTNSTAGILTVEMLSGNLDSSVFYTHGNTVSANQTNFSVSNTNPTNIYVSNGTMTVSNLVMTSANNEYAHYFSFLDTITQPMATINYSNATGQFANGQTIYTYSSGSLMGTGTILASIAGQDEGTGTLTVNILTGSLNNTFYTTSNLVSAIPNATNGYINSTASGQFIANTDTVELNLSSNAAPFIIGEVLYQGDGFSVEPTLDKVGGFGVITATFGNTLQVNVVNGKFIGNNIGASQITGSISGQTSVVLTMTTTIGVVNTVNQFLSGNNTFFYSSLMSGTITEYTDTGSGYQVAASGNLTFQETDSINIDLLSSMASVDLNAATYPFPANPTSNQTSGTIQSTMNMDMVTLGQIANVFIVGVGENFTQAPFVVIDSPLVSQINIQDRILQIDNPAFGLGEVVQLVSEGPVKGEIIAANTGAEGSFITVRRYSYSNAFTLSTNSATQLVSANSGAKASIIALDSDYFSPVMGRNAVILSEVVIGNNAVANGQIVSSGFGFVDGENVNVGSNGAVGVVGVQSQGTGAGYYRTKGGFLSDQKKLYDGYFWQNFSYQIISNLMIDRYQQMVQDITHPAGTIMFGEFLYDTQDNNSLNTFNAIVAINGNVVSNSSAQLILDYSGGGVIAQPWGE